MISVKIKLFAGLRDLDAFEHPVDLFGEPLELGEHGRDVGERVGLGVLVDAVHHRRVAVPHVAGDDLVGRDHRLLDHVGGHGLLP